MKNIPTFPLRESVSFPNSVVRVRIDRQELLNTYRAARKRSKALLASLPFHSGKYVFLVAQKDVDQAPTQENLAKVGVLAMILHPQKTESGMLEVSFSTKDRKSMKTFQETGGVYYADLSSAKSTGESADDIAKEVIQEMRRILKSDPQHPLKSLKPHLDLIKPPKLSNLGAIYASMDRAEKIELIECLDVRERLQRIKDSLASE